MEDCSCDIGVTVCEVCGDEGCESELHCIICESLLCDNLSCPDCNECGCGETCFGCFNCNSDCTCDSGSGEDDSGGGGYFGGGGGSSSGSSGNSGSGDNSNEASSSGDKINYKEHRYEIEKGSYFGMDPDQDAPDVSPSQEYRGHVNIVKSVNGRYYAEAFAETRPGGQNGHNINGHIRIVHNGESAGYQYLRMKNEWGSNFYDSSWSQLGYARLYLPETGNVSLRIHLNSNKVRWWGGNSLHTLYEGYINFP